MIKSIAIYPDIVDDAYVKKVDDSLYKVETADGFCVEKRG